MISLREAKTGRNKTGLHMVQHDGKQYKYRCCVDSIQRLTSVSVKPEYLELFTHRADGVFHSGKFDTVEAAGQNLCAFIEMLTGCKCTIS